MIKTFSKYRRRLVIAYQSRMEHRFSVFCSIAVFMFPLVAQIVFWKAVYQSGSGAISGFDLSDMVTYLLVIQFVSEFTWCHPGIYRVRPDIVGGALTGQLLLPAKYMHTVFFDWTGSMFPRVTSTAAIFAVLVLLFVDEFRISTEPWIIAAFLLSSTMCYLMMFAFSFLMGLAAFWTESDVPLVSQLQRLFAGRIVPLAFLPPWLQDVSNWLPFQYTLYFPTLLLQGKMQLPEFLKGIIIQSIWIAILLLLIHVVWRRGIRRYSAYGG
jgi:ABC-2 type transport system permease protein